MSSNSNRYELGIGEGSGSQPSLDRIVTADPYERSRRRELRRRESEGNPRSCRDHFLFQGESLQTNLNQENERAQRRRDREERTRQEPEGPTKKEREREALEARLQALQKKQTDTVEHMVDLYVTDQGSVTRYAEDALHIWNLHKDRSRLRNVAADRENEERRDQKIRDLLTKMVNIDQDYGYQPNWVRNVRFGYWLLKLYDHVYEREQDDNLERPARNQIFRHIEQEMRQEREAQRREREAQEASIAVNAVRQAGQGVVRLIENVPHRQRRRRHQ